MEIIKGLHKRIPMITKASIAKRLSWFKENIRRHWNKVIFRDESKFKMFQINKKQWCNKRKQIPVPNYASSINVCGAVSVKSTFQLKMMKKMK